VLEGKKSVEETIGEPLDVLRVVLIPILSVSALRQEKSDEYVRKERGFR
jgi:hypothetical protein